MDNGTKTTTPFHLWKHAVLSELTARGAYPGPEWVKSQAARFNLFFNSGETVSSAAETLAAFADAHLHPLAAPSLTPLQMARKYGRVVRK